MIKNKSGKPLHLFTTLIGDISRENFAQVKYGFLIEALSRYYIVDTCDVTLRGIPRLMNALRSFSPNRDLWKARFYQNLLSFDWRSRVAETELKKKKNIDMILQIGVTYNTIFHANTIPNIVYTDYTAHLSSLKPKMGRSPLSTKDLQRWLSMEKDVFDYSSHICTRSQYVRRSVNLDYDIALERVTSIGGGVNFGSLPQVDDRIENNELKILFIGKDFYRKGGDLVLNAFMLVKEKLPTAQLIMVTEGIPRGGYDFTNVQVINPTWDRARIQELYKQADCFVLPSRLETWGDVLLEAMAFCLPCIGVSGEAMDEIIDNGETGFLVPQENIKALSEAIIYLLSNKRLRIEFGHSARKKVETFYTWDKVVERLIPIIESGIR